MKNLVIAGRVGKDAELRRSQDGTPVLGFTVAVDDGYGQNKSTIWFDVSLWGKRGESLEGLLRKGTPVTVSGELGTREHAGKTYLTIRANDVTLQGGKRESADDIGMSGYARKEDRPARNERRQSYGEASGGTARVAADMDDEIPFTAEWR